MMVSFSPFIFSIGMILHISFSHEKEVEPQEEPMLFVMAVGQDPVKGFT